MPIIADTISAAARSRLGVIAEPEPEPPPSRREVTAKRAALVERDGNLDWQGQPVAPCSRCGRVFVAASLRTFYGPGSTALICRRCKGEHIG